MSPFLRQLAELKEPRSWMHHVADAVTGKLLSIQLDRPVTQLSRAERLSQLGQQFYPPIFWAPTHRLTPRYPYQASPQGFVDFSFTSTMSSVGHEPTGRADWLLQYIVPPWTGRMDAVLRDAPARCGSHYNLRRLAQSLSHPVQCPIPITSQYSDLPR